MKTCLMSLIAFNLLIVGLIHANTNDFVKAMTDTTLFNGGNWSVVGGADTGPIIREIVVFVEGHAKGTYSEIKVFYKRTSKDIIQLFSVKGNGAIRSVLPPPGEFGGTFYATGYWDLDPDTGFVQNMEITQLEIHIDPKRNTILEFQGMASNIKSFDAPDFKLRFRPPTGDSVIVEVSYTLVATRDFLIDSTRQKQHEGFRISRIASNYINQETHDSDQARYVDIHLTEVCRNLQNNGTFIFDAPFPSGEPELFLIHTDTIPRRTPTLTIRYINPPSQEITPQGYVTYSTDKNDDNVDIWGNWDFAESSYSINDTIGKFSYEFIAIPPGVSCCPTGVTVSEEMVKKFVLQQNYPNPFNTETKIDFDLSEKTTVTIEISNLLGHQIDVLLDKEMTAGFHTVRWNGENVASGTYFYRLNAGNFTQTKKMLLLR